MSQTMREALEVLNFLEGQGDLEGVGFGQLPDGERYNFWWRRHLPKLHAALSAPSSEQAQQGAEPTAQTIKDLMLGLRCEDRPGNLWESTTVGEKAVALKVLRAFASRPAAAAPADLDALLTKVLNSRVGVEQELFDMASGKKPMPDAAKLRELAVRLGDPKAREAVAPAVGVTEALMDSQYLAGVMAGWNAAQEDDPNAALQRIHASRAGYLAPLKQARAALAGAAQGAEPVGWGKDDAV